MKRLSIFEENSLFEADEKLGATMRELSDITRLDDSTLNRRYDIARQRSKENTDLQKTVTKVIKTYSKA